MRARLCSLCQLCVKTNLVTLVLHLHVPAKSVIASELRSAKLTNVELPFLKEYRVILYGEKRPDSTKSFEEMKKLQLPILASGKPTLAYLMCFYLVLAQPCFRSK